MTGERRKSLWIWAGLIAFASIAGLGWMVYDLYVPRAASVEAAMDAALAGDVEATCDLARFFRRNPQAVHTLIRGQTLVMVVASNFGVDSSIRFRLLDLLLSHGADINALSRASEGYAPLHLAVQHCDMDMVTYLVAHGADPNARTDSGFTSLHFAACNIDPNRDMTEYLLDHGADPNASSHAPRNDDHVTSGWTPLFTAIEMSNYDQADVLLSHGATPNTRLTAEAMDDGRSPLHLAEQRDDLDMVRLLLNAGANVDAADDRGVTPLIDAVLHDRDEMARFLLKQGATFDCVYGGREHVLHFTARHGLHTSLMLLLRYGADPNMRDSHGRTALDVVTRGSQDAADADAMVKQFTSAMRHADSVFPDAMWYPDIGFGVDLLLRRQDRCAELLRQHGGLTSAELDAAKTR
ncbi:MAG: hypothetical protein GC159_01560 [Phycisphaera sp.]|nr:hypothetical protein [Phycisphaera sp.]